MLFFRKDKFKQPYNINFLIMLIRLQVIFKQFNQESKKIRFQIYVFPYYFENHVNI